MQRELPQVGKALRASFLPRLRSVDEKARTIEFVASTEAVDRYGDVIRVAGWKLQNYLKNPVFLWGHRSGEPPIGKCVDLKIESNPPALVQTIEFASAATYPFADTVFQLYREGFMRAVSVGFMPLEMAPIPDGGMEFLSQELLELSAVPIPANQEALARCKGLFPEADLAAVFTGRQEPTEPPEPPEDEPAGSPADNAEELAEQLDEIATEVADAQKLCAVLISQLEGTASEEDSAKPAVTKQPATVSGILARMLTSKTRLAAVVTEQPQKAADEDIQTLEQLGDALKPDEISSLEELGETETFAPNGSRRWREIK